MLILALPLTGCVPQTQYNTLLEEKASLAVGLASFAVELAGLQDDYSRLAEEMAEVSNAYPPKHFSDRFELVEWRKKVGVIDSSSSWVDACLGLQHIGLLDGYKISIDLDETELGMSLTVIAGGYFFQIYPDELDVYLIGLVY